MKTEARGASCRWGRERSRQPWWASDVTALDTDRRRCRRLATGSQTAFDSDIRNLVYRWNPEDQRPPTRTSRRRSLRSSIRPTIRLAWIPQSLFDSNLVTQVVAGDIETIVRDEVGLVLWPENTVIPAYGMAPNVGSDNSRSAGPSIASSAIPPRSTASRTSARARKCSTTSGWASR